MNPWIISFDAKCFPLKKLRLNNREGSIQGTKAVSSDTSLVEAWGNQVVVEGMDAKWKILDRQWCPWGVCCALSREVHGSKTDGFCISLMGMQSF